MRLREGNIGKAEFCLLRQSFRYNGVATLSLRLFKGAGSVAPNATHVIHKTRRRHEADMAHRLHKERKVKLTTPIAVTYYNLRIDTALAVRHNVQI